MKERQTKPKGQMKEMITFEKREFKGSRFRCLQLTSMGPKKLQNFLGDLVAPHATIPDDFHYVPRGFVEPNESVLAERDGFSEEIVRAFVELKKWWLVLEKGTLPNWDLVSTCEIGGKRGLLLVEAKAHEGELKGKTDGSSVASENMTSIQKALDSAGVALGLERAGFQLSLKEFFQLSNRFAFSWKLATMGIPVVLVYLGFLEADDMGTRSRILKDGESWEAFVKKLSAPCIPGEAWGHPFCQGTFIPLIRSARVELFAQVTPSQNLEAPAERF
jgi:hypothetical protein